MSAAPGHPYRLSDAERGEAISTLSEAYAEGRLTAAEFDERLDAASRARFAADLDDLFVDLPPQPRRDVPVRSERSAVRRPRPPLFLIPVGVLVVLILVGQAWLLLPLAFLIVARTMPGSPRSGHRAWRGQRGAGPCGRR